MYILLTLFMLLLCKILHSIKRKVELDEALKILKSENKRIDNEEWLKELISIN